MVRRAEDSGADGIELNFGCPHGMSERGMGSTVGQVPDYTCQIVSWVKEVARIPVIVKLTPMLPTSPPGPRSERVAPMPSRSSTPSTRSLASISTR